MSKIKLMVVSVVLAVLLITISSAAVPAWVVSMVEGPVPVMEIAGRGSGGGSFS
jgi:hypothetical protein